MSEPQKAARKPRRWLRWLRLLAVTFVLLLAGLVLLGFYLYHNLTGVVVWFANRSHPALSLELQHAEFINNHQIEFQNLALKPGNAGAPVLTIEKAVVDFNWADLRDHHIGTVHVENPRLAVTDALLNQPAQKTTAETKIVSADGLWLVDEFKVTGGTAEIDLSHSPLVRFGFTSDLREIYLSSEIRFSTQSQALNISNVEFIGREAKPAKFGTIKSITVSFSLDHIAQNKIDALVITAPSLSLTSKLLEVFGAGSAHGTNASGTSASPALPWEINSFNLTDGEFFMKEFGDNIPETSMKFAIDKQDVQFGASADASGDTSHKIQIWDIRGAAAFARLQPFLWVGSAEVDFTANGLFQRKQLEALTITEMDFQIGQAFRSLLAATDQKANVPPAQAAPDESSPWSIRTLHIINGRATIAELGPELPDIGFNLDTEMNDVALSSEIRHASNTEQEVVISDLTIPSPNDPFVPVLNFATIRLRFSLAQILDQQIDRVILEKPSIFVGQQLFWYVDELKQRQAAAPAVISPQVTQLAAPQSNWIINEFSAREGSLVLENAGTEGVTMPFKFNTEVKNLHLNNMGESQSKVTLKIDKADYPFPSYQLEFKQLYGSIDFGLPPDTNARNLVQTLQADAAKWRQFDARQLWLSVTYDSHGIYGKFGGAGYNGYLTGAFDFYMLPDTPWAGWVSGSKVDLGQITDILAPQNFQMSGPADFNIAVNGLNHQILRLAGSVKTKKGGTLKISKLDQIIASIPPTWSSLKQGTTRIMLETLRDFDYTDGNGDFWYAGDKGHLTLKIQGPHGSRNFDIALHGD